MTAIIKLLEHQILHLLVAEQANDKIVTKLTQVAT
jgi:hypothetical protein